MFKYCSSTRNRLWAYTCRNLILLRRGKKFIERYKVLYFNIQLLSRGGGRVVPFLAQKKKRPRRAKKNSPSLLAKEGIKNKQKISVKKKKTAKILSWLANFFLLESWDLPS